MAQKTLLMILDGWGNSTDSSVSAIDKAKTPFIDSLYENYESNVLKPTENMLGFQKDKWAIVKSVI